MKLKSKTSITILTSLIAASSAVTPIAVLCKETFNYNKNSDVATDKENSTTTDVSGSNDNSPIGGETIEPGIDNSGGNDDGNTGIIGNKRGSLPTEMRELEKNKDSNKYHLMTAKNTVDFLDYDLPSTDEKGVYRFLKDRGDLLKRNMELTLNKNLKQNKDDFLKSFDFNSYKNIANNSSDSSNVKIPNPSNEMFLNDIYYWFIQLYYANKQYIDIGIINSNVNFNSDNNNISFDVTVSIKNVRNINIEFNYFDKKTTLLPGKVYNLNLKSVNQKIKNVINVSDNRYFLGWSLSTIQVSFDNNQFNYNNFNPTINSSTFTYMIEFLNLTNDTSDTSANSADAMNFMKNLKTSTIKENIERTIFDNTTKAFKVLPSLGKIFDSLDTDPTIGEFLYASADPLANIMLEFNMIPSELSPLVSDLIKSAHTGQGLLTVIEKHKAALSSGLKKLLVDTVGEFADIIDNFINKIKVGMNKEEVDVFLNLLNLIYPDSNDNTKTLISIILKLLLGEFDANGKLINSGNPFVFDFIDKLFNDQLFDTTYKLLDNFGLQIDKNILKTAVSIFTTLADRTRSNVSADGSSSSIYYKNKILYKLFDIKKTGYNTANWWLLDNVISLLNAMGLNVGNDNTSLLYELIKQSYSLDVNRPYVNYVNAWAVVTELKRAVNFLADRNNFDIIGNFVKLPDGQEVSYNNQTFVYNFTYKYKLVFKKSFKFNIDVILNVLPSKLYIEIYKLTGEEWVKIKWALSTFGFYTKQRYVSLDLNRILYRMFPRKLMFEVGDSFNMEYKSNNRKLIYAQNYKDGQYYHGFNSIMDVESYFDQALPYKGVISNAMSTAWDMNDFADIDTDNSMNKEHPDWRISEVTASIQYESGSNKQSKQNVAIVKELVQKLLVNRMTFNVNLMGVDTNKPISNEPSNNVFYSGNTFKWLDVDFNKELISLSNSPKFNSEKYTQYYNMFSYIQSVRDFAIYYDHVNDSRGNRIEGVFERQIANFSDESSNILANELFSLGSGVDKNNTLISIKPITNLKITKTVDIKGGADVVILGHIDSLTTQLSLSIEFMMFQATVIAPNKLLDLTNATRNGNEYSLSTYKFSNVFNKVFMAPRIAVKIPNL